MSRPTLGVIAVLAGIGIMIVSLLADPLGIGSQPGVLGWKQILGAIGGMVIAVVGIRLSRQSGGARGGPPGDGIA